MAVNKSFVVKNGLEVNTSLIFADANKNKVGIATTNPQHTLHVRGGIGATELYVSGVATASAFYGDGSNLTFGGPLTLPGLVVSGVSTLGVTTATNLTLQNLYVSGIGTIISGFVTNFTGVAGTITNLSATNGSVTNLTGTAGTITNLSATNGSVTNLTGTAGTITTLNVTSGSVTNLTGTIGTITTLNVTSGSVTNLTGTIGTIGSVQISSGIVTASSGIVTYYGDGSKLTNITSGVGIATAGGTVGTGATVLDFRGAGISTVTVTSGIATINITGGGGGGGSIGIGSTFPVSSTNGSLFFHIDYGRTFVYYDEVALGIGATAVWVDSAPFNQGGLYVNKYGDNMFAGLGVTTGSLTNPSVYFNGYTNSGFYSPSANEFGIVVSGTQRLNVNAGGINVTGVTTITNSSGTVIIGVGTTALLVEGNARVTGILTVGTGSITLNGATDRINVGTGLTLSSSGIIAGVITATSFVGDGSGLTGAGSTVANDTTTNTTFYPLFTTVTSGTVTSTKVSTSKLTFNPSTGRLTATSLGGSLANTLTLNTSGTGLSGSTTFDNSGAATFTVTSNATSSNTGSAIVARDGSGNFSAGTVTATAFVGDGSGLTGLAGGGDFNTNINSATAYAVTNSMATAYTAPATAGRYVVRSIHVTNITTTEQSISGQMYSGAFSIGHLIPIPAGSSVELLKQPKVLSPNETIQLEASSNSALHATITVEPKTGDTKFVGTGVDITSASTYFDLWTATANSVVQSILLANDDGTVDVKATVVWTNGSNTIQGYYAYEMVIPADSTVEILEQSKYLQSGFKVRVLANQPNRLEAIIAAKTV